VRQIVDAYTPPGLNLKPGALSPETFPLPEELAKRLRTLTHGCYEGRGFAILRGLDPAAHSDEENVLIFGGVSSHVAPIRGFQDLAREMVICKFHGVAEKASR
jgi:hypothetical protein